MECGQPRRIIKLPKGAEGDRDLQLTVAISNSVNKISATVTSAQILKKKKTGITLITLLLHLKVDVHKRSCLLKTTSVSALALGVTVPKTAH